MHKLEKVRKFLSESNIRAVAEAAGVHQGTLHKIMKGSSTSSDVAELLSDYVDSKINKLNER